MKRILVFNRTFFSLSETFIERQVCGLSQQFSISLLAFKFEGANSFQNLNKYQIHFAHGILDRILTLVARRFFFLKLPFSIRTSIYINRLLKVEKFDFIHAHYGWNAIAILPFAKKHRIPLVVSFHGLDASGKLRIKEYRNKLPDLFNYASSIVVCSPHMISSLQLDAWRSKVRIIPYGVDSDEFIGTPFKSKKPNLIDILHAGRLVPKKGVPDLILVFSKLRSKYHDIHLHILGDGKEKNECMRLVGELNLNNAVTFYGGQGQTKVKELMNMCDIFVLNSRTDQSGDMEGLPNSILEAMSFGKPVVSTIHAGIEQAIINDYNGLLVGERDNHNLALSIERLINKSDLRLILGINARKTIIANFTITKMINDLAKVFST